MVEAYKLPSPITTMNIPDISVELLKGVSRAETLDVLSDVMTNCHLVQMLHLDRNVAVCETL
jgi:hypothetical protein